MAYEGNNNSKIILGNGVIHTGQFFEVPISKNFLCLNCKVHLKSLRVGSSEVVVVRYCSELQFSSSQ
jgi:hypothetical protein